MSNLLHCDIGEVVQYLKEQNKVFYAIRLSDCLQHSNESLVKLTIENQKLRKERDEARQIACNREAELNRMMFDNPKYSDSAAIAAQRGWDCFKEDTDV